MIHGVKAGWFADEEVGGGEGAARKGVAAVGGVREGEALFGGGEVEGVFADDLSGAQRMDPDIGEVLGEEERSAAGSVFLMGVVRFNEVDIGGEERGDLSGEFAKEGDAEAEVGRIEDGEALGGGFEGSEAGVAGGADDDGFLRREIFEKGMG